jgi:hypothetical protein
MASRDVLATNLHGLAAEQQICYSHTSGHRPQFLNGDAHIDGFSVPFTYTIMCMEVWPSP